MHVATLPSSSSPAALEPTLHACARYAQLVLGLRIGERELLRDPKLLGRCTRGIERLVARADVGPELIGEPGRALLLVGTRALVVHGRQIMTILVSPNPKGFGKRLLRDPDLVAA